MRVSDVSFTSQDFKIKSTDLYLTNERNTKLIYKNLNTFEVTGIAGFLNGKIIEVLEKRIVNKQEYYRVQYEGQLIGWISLEKSIRVFRIPTLLGKYTSDERLTIEHLEFNYDITDFQGKIIEAKYYFLYEGNPGLLVNTASNNEYIMPVKFDLFHKLIALPKNTVLKIDSGTKLYQNNTFDHVVEEMQESNPVEVTAYFEDLGEARVVLNNRKYWIKKELELNHNTSESKLDDIELIDKIIYLKNKNKKLSNRLKQEERTNEFMKQNISIDNELQKLFLKRYLGDFDEVE